MEKDMQPILGLLILLEWPVSPMRIYIVDEHLPVRVALADRLSRSREMQVVGHTGSADEVMEDVQQRQPDVVILEVKRSDGMGLELLRQLADLVDHPHLVVLTSYPSSWEEQAAARAGAVSYLLKEIETDLLIEQLCELG